MAQGVGPEFKPQYHKTKQNKTLKSQLNEIVIEFQAFVDN
jgi:hypothetical protein